MWRAVYSAGKVSGPFLLRQTASGTPLPRAPTARPTDISWKVSAGYARSDQTSGATPQIGSASWRSDTCPHALLDRMPSPRENRRTHDRGEPGRPMKITEVRITEPHRAELVDGTLDERLGPDDLLIRTEHSGVSSGTELAVYTGLHQWIADPAYPDWVFPFARRIESGSELLSLGGTDPTPCIQRQRRTRRTDAGSSRTACRLKSRRLVASSAMDGEPRRASARRWVAASSCRGSGSLGRGQCARSRLLGPTRSSGSTPWRTDAKPRSRVEPPPALTPPPTTSRRKPANSSVARRSRTS